MEIVIAKDRSGLGTFAAFNAANAIAEQLRENLTVRLVLATGSSQFDVIEALVNQVTIDWPRIEAFHLDEYIGLSIDHPASFCNYLKHRIVDKVPIKSFHYLDGTQDPYGVCDAASAAILSQPIDLIMLGIGENGHLAFNDPPADFKAPYSFQVVQLDDMSRRQQVGEGWFDQLDHVPRRAISMSIPCIMSAKKIICSVPDRRKANAVAAAVMGPVTPNVPASILQQHSNVCLVLDQGSAECLPVELTQYAKRI